MRKASLLASAIAASTALAAVPVFAQGGGPFADVPTDHWAYGAVDRLQKENIVIGYPDGTYGGKRAMTRYEFAVAIARLLDRIPPKVDTSQFATKDELTKATAGLASKEEVDTVRRLVSEFQNELTTLGVDLDAVKRRLDALEGRVTALEDEIKRVRIGGQVNFMVRGNHRRSDSPSFVDNDGYVVTGGPGTKGSLLSDTRVLHDLDLNVKARLSETATAEAVVNFGNYLPFLNSISSFSGSRSDRPSAPYAAGTVNQSQEQTIYKLAVEAPVRVLGANLAFSVGRIPVQYTPYTLKLIDVDSYFANDKTDLGDIPVDGAKVSAKFGSLGLTAFGAKVDPIKYVSDIDGKISGTIPGYGLFAGAGRSPFTGGFAGTGRPTKSLINPLQNGAMPVENLFGARLTFGTSFLGTIGATFLGAGGRSAADLGLVPVGSRGDFDTVYVYGADINANFGGVGVTASYTQSDMKSARGETGGDTENRIDDDNYAWDAAASYNLGSLSLGAGYKYIGAFFGAPGYWDKLGSWTNPVDVKGPYARVSYAFGGGLSLLAEGRWFEGTDDAVDQGGLTNDDKVQHYKAGLKYGLTSASGVDLGVEYTRYDLAGGGGKPEEIFYNIGYGFSFNPSTSFKILYQVVDYNDKGSGFDPLNRDGGVAAAQFSVKF